MSYLIFYGSQIKDLESPKVFLQIIQGKKVENFVRLNRKCILLYLLTLPKGLIFV